MIRQAIHDKAGRLLESIDEFTAGPDEVDDQALALAFIARALALLVAAQTMQAEQTMK